MKCPKCGYLGFDQSDRCRNCGYDFGLAIQPAPPEVSIRPPAGAGGPVPDFALHDSNPAGSALQADTTPALRKTATAGSELPLFGDADEDDLPLIRPSRVPRPPLAVRRPTPDLTRSRTRLGHDDASVLPLALEPSEPASFDSEPVPVTETSRSPAPRAGAIRRLLAATIDLTLLCAIDVAVLYFTLRLCGLTLIQLGVLPAVPLLAFFWLLGASYVVVFTAAVGQTLGKMALGIMVVTNHDEPVGIRHAVLRGLGYTVSALPLGLGFVPIFFGARRRTLHDRLADTRVVVGRAAAQ